MRGFSRCYICSVFIEADRFATACELMVMLVQRTIDRLSDSFQVQLHQNLVVRGVM